jgi:hypothetical protein
MTIISFLLLLAIVANKAGTRTPAAAADAHGRGSSGGGAARILRVGVCPEGTTQMGSARGGALLACEDLAERAGHITFVAANGSGWSLRLGKTAEHLYVDEASLYCGFNKSQVAASLVQRGRPNGTAGSDILGDKILASARRRGTDPTLAEVSAALAPLVYDGGYNLDDPAHGGRGRSGGNSHTFVGSRGSSVDTCFDTMASSTVMIDNPTMSSYPGKYHRTSAVFKDRLDTNGTLEGLWGGHLPVVCFNWPIVGGPPPPPPPPGGPTHCTTVPQPCPTHPGRTWCASDKEPGQCDKPSVKSCPPCPPPPPPPHAHCVPPQKPCKVHQGKCCGPAESEQQRVGHAGMHSSISGGWVEWTAVPVPGESQRLLIVVESPWSQFTSECQRFGHPPRLDD